MILIIFVFKKEILKKRFLVNFVIMGQNESASDLPEDQLVLDLTMKDLQFLPYRIKPEHPIEKMFLSKNKLSIIPSKLDNLIILDISFNNLCSIPINIAILEYPKLEILNISSNWIEQLPFCVGNFSKIKEIIANRNRLTEFSFGIENLDECCFLDLFLNLFSFIPQLPRNLKRLNMGFNYIKLLDLEHCNLVHLEVQGNDISEISESCRLPKLEKLDISMNCLIKLPDLSLIAPNLQEINASYNLVSDFPISLPQSLKKINVSHNYIKYISAEITTLSSLYFLDVSFNEIDTLPEIPSSIVELKAENNHISNDVYIDKCPVTKLYFNNNQLKQIPNVSHSHISHLLLKNNQIEVIDMNRICEKLVIVDFSMNQIREIPPPLVALLSLQYLDISNNGIKFIPNEIANSHIMSLNISQNPISCLPDLPSTLAILIAVSCDFSEIPKSLFSFQRLNCVNFSNNRISNLGEFPKASNIILSCNRISCIPLIPDVASSLDLSHNVLQSFSMDDPNLYIQELDISHNLIKSLSINSVFLQVFKVSYNAQCKAVLSFSDLPCLQFLDICMTMIKIPFDIPRSIKLITIDPSITGLPNDKRIRCVKTQRCGYSETKGARNTMEDSFIIYEGIRQDLSIYAVIDGHNGFMTSHYAANMLPELFLGESNNSISAFSKVFKKFNNELRVLNTMDGATIMICLVSSTKISCAYLGDTRALLINRDGSVINLSHDHKPTILSEMRNIKENRSFVKEERTAGSLAVSRALGDFNVEGVSRTPEMICQEIKPDSYRLVIACDGVFDVMEPEEIGRIVARIDDVSYAAALVRNIAIAKSSSDNITVLVITINN